MHQDKGMTNMFNMNNIMGELAKNLAPGFKDVISDYMAKDAKTDNVTWLGSLLAKQLPNLAPEGIAQIGQGLIGGVSNFNARMASMEAAAAQGKASAEWLRDYLEDNLPKADMQSSGDYLEQMYNNMAAGNEVAQQAVADPNGMINITEEALAAEAVASGQEWNRITMQPMVADLGQQAELMGLNAMGMPLGNEFMQQAMSMPTGIIPEEYIAGEPSATMDQGIKLAAAAAIKIFIEKKKLSFISKIIPVHGITDIACWGVEGAKCIGKLAMGKISAAQALEHMKKTSVVALTGFIANGVAPKLLGMIPVVGMPLGIAASALLASMSTEEIQQKLAQGISVVADVATEMADGIAATVKAGVNTVKNSVMQFLGVEA